MTDLKTLALAANSAHPCVPWHNSDDLIAIGIDDDCDAAFVAAASPDAILKLLAERDRLREALADLMAWQVKNVKVWNNSAYDQAVKALE